MYHCLPLTNAYPSIARLLLHPDLFSMYHCLPLTNAYPSIARLLLHPRPILHVSLFTTYKRIPQYSQITAAPPTYSPCIIVYHLQTHTPVYTDYCCAPDLFSMYHCLPLTNAYPSIPRLLLHPDLFSVYHCLPLTNAYLSIPSLLLHPRPILHVSLFTTKHTPV